MTWKAVISIANYGDSLLPLLWYKIIISLHHLSIYSNILYPTYAAKDQRVNCYIHDAVCLHPFSLLLWETMIIFMMCWLSAFEKTDTQTLLWLSNIDINFFFPALNSNCISNKLWEINGFRQDIKIRILSFLNYFVTHFKLKLKALCFCHTSLVSQKVRMYISRQAKMGDWLSPCNSCIFWRCCTKYKAF